MKSTSAANDLNQEIKRFMEKIASITSGVKPRMIRSMDEFIKETKV